MNVVDILKKDNSHLKRESRLRESLQRAEPHSREPADSRSRSRLEFMRSDHRRRRTNASSISAYVKFALRPLGFGTTNTRAPWIATGWGPRAACKDFNGGQFSSGRTARYKVTPTNAT